MTGMDKKLNTPENLTLGSMSLESQNFEILICGDQCIGWKGLAWRNTDCLRWQEAGFAARSPNRMDAGILHISCLATETLCPHSCQVLIM